MNPEKIHKKYRGVLFDFDGVVIDSMHQHYDAWSKAFAERNISFSKESFFQLEGQGLNTIARMLAEPYGLKEKELLDVIEAKARYYYTFEQVKFYNYFFDLLHFLKEKNIPMAVVTGGNRDRVEQVIRKHLDNFFTTAVTIDDVEHGKPHPEPFLKGAQKLNFNAEDCVVVENAPLGIKAAKAAGCKVIAIKTTLSEDYLEEADIIVDDFKELQNVLATLLVD